MAQIQKKRNNSCEFSHQIAEFDSNTVISLRGMQISNNNNNTIVYSNLESMLRDTEKKFYLKRIV